ncbi:nuclear transport factor 2 family protein [Vibrio salinus]|uniref:nuclear transport factor 2 family protein n=1 Tax=Vibrio salinus TaxID=2899784 RepID=UPI001E3DCFA9|nr:nuclear transport factor 2 family protein [Vibrio salinus]MCE0493772.1 hypothetical protein [Vibrio salinus]
MLNILIPLAGKNTFKTDSNNPFPKILTEVDGKLIIERAARSLIDLKHNKIVVAIPKNESEQFRLKNVISLLSDSIEICSINGDTQGAACSALLAIEHLDLDSPLVISSFEQILDFDLNPYIEDFQNSGVDAGILTFEAIHPKWSFVKVNTQQIVTQAAEKNPISKNAIAGLYYYKTARQFVEAAKSIIRKDVKTNGLFFISQTLNEIILKEGVVKALPIDKTKYFHINDEYSLTNFEDSIREENNNKKEKIRQLTEKYIQYFNSKEITALKTMFSNNFELIEPDVTFSGKETASTHIEKIFKNNSDLHFDVKKIYIESQQSSILEFELQLSDCMLSGVDIITWDEQGKITSLKAYLNEK